MNTWIRKYIFVSFLVASILIGLQGNLWSKGVEKTRDSLIHHRLSVTVEPEKAIISVTDTIIFPAVEPGKAIHFLLHGNLELAPAPDGVEIRKETGELKKEYFGINTAAFEIKSKIPLSHYSLRFKNPSANKCTVTLKYKGIIDHAVKKTSAEYARGFSETPGIIDKQGFFLAGSTFWIPWFNDTSITYSLTTTVPEGWDTVSQGTRLNGTWNCPEPMEEIYLIGAKFHYYSREVGKVRLEAYLRTPDEGLANKYLETTGQYLEMYEQLIGPYPYSKFALVENFWETGYGMPSFTLLGSKIIRFPFILHSSYPHELLHNWWGNGVLVDYAKGNWCEGLTVYLADHLIKEQRGQGVDYRKTTLQGYTHYAWGKDKEFPLSKFKARYDALSSSIGYGKSMMVFHMLRRMVGDKAFKKAIRHFYKNNKFKAAAFGDIRHSFETVCKEELKKNGLEDLDVFFRQWVDRIGTPDLSLADAKVKKTADKNKTIYTLSFGLMQNQAGEPYYLHVPAAVYLKGETEPVTITPVMTGKEKKQFYRYEFSKPVETLHVDPWYDVARKLHMDEISPTLSAVFGAEQVFILLPSKASAKFIKGYRELAETWGKENEKIRIMYDTDLWELPHSTSIWVLGHENKYANYFKSSPAKLDESGIVLEKKKLEWDKYSIVAAIKGPLDVMVLLSTDRVEALPGLARKLPHYGKYSYLAFEGDEPSNMAKGQWPIINVFLSAFFTEDGKPGKPVIRPTANVSSKPLARLKPLFSGDRMMKDIGYLSSDELEGRGLASKGLEKAAHYVATEFKKAGLEPGGDNRTFFQTWEAPAGPQNVKSVMKNVIGVLRGTDQKRLDEAVVICAHLDHLGLGYPDVKAGNKGKIHPGADDNASGVSIILELARTLGKSLKPERSIIFIAFTGEESGRLGSKYYIKHLKNSPFKTITAAVNLDTVGRLRDQKLKVIGGSSAREWRFIFMGIQYTVGVESELLGQDLDSSDQASFHEAGIPAIQLFSGAHTDYHTPGDTIDKIDSKGLVKVASVAREAIVYLADRKEPMTITLKTGKTSSSTKPTQASGGRKVRTGLMPDFSFKGEGVKIGFVSPVSPAASAGLKQGDVIIKVNGTEVLDLKTYSSLLKLHKPGDEITVVFKRESEVRTVNVKLEAR